MVHRLVQRRWLQNCLRSPHKGTPSAQHPCCPPTTTADAPYQQPLHLRQALIDNLRDEVVGHVNSSSSSLTAGLLPHQARFQGKASLTALEVFPRKMSTFGLLPREAHDHIWWPISGAKACQDNCLLPFLPLKLVGTRTVRQWLHHNASDPPTSKVVMDFAFENVFNCIDRRTSFQQCRQHCPMVAPWTEWFYTSPTLLFGNVVVLSTTGVQQGDLAQHGVMASADGLTCARPT